MPVVSLSAMSSSLHGYYRSASGDNRLSELYPSPRASSVVVRALLLPTGGLSYGMGGVGELPSASYLQDARPAVSHSILVQTPHVYPNMANLAVLVQCYDEFGHSDVSSAALSISVGLAGASSQSLSAYQLRGPGGAALTRRYQATIPSIWFSTASVAGSTATVSAALGSGSTHTADFMVYGTPSWFLGRLSSAGIAGYMTSDAGGTTPAQTMRLGETFYLQLYAHTGGQEMSSFEVKIVEDTNVCQVSYRHADCGRILAPERAIDSICACTCEHVGKGMGVPLCDCAKSSAFGVCLWRGA